MHDYEGFMRHVNTHMEGSNVKGVVIRDGKTLVQFHGTDDEVGLNDFSFRRYPTTPFVPPLSAWTTEFLNAHAQMLLDLFQATGSEMYFREAQKVLWEQQRRTALAIAEMRFKARAQAISKRT